MDCATEICDMKSKQKPKSNTVERTIPFIGGCLLSGILLLLCKSELIRLSPEAIASPLVVISLLAYGNRLLLLLLPIPFYAFAKVNNIGKSLNAKLKQH